MRILIIGASGFIGNALFHSLTGRHTLIIGGRTPIEGYKDYVKIDFSQKNDYKEILRGIDLVINAVGIIEGDFDKVQTRGPLELFKNCKEEQIEIINISAIGAEKQHPETEFLKSKKRTDDFIISQTDGKVIYPGIVLGNNAESSKFFKELSALPFIPLLNDKPIPFIHITQLLEVINEVIEQYDKQATQIFAVALPETMKEVFIALKNDKAKFIKIPGTVLTLLFKFFPKFTLGVFNKNMFALFNNTRAADYQPMFPKASLLLQGNHIKPSHHLLHFFALAALAFIWIWSGLISLYSWKISLDLMAGIGISHSFGRFFVIAGSIADILLGAGLLIKKFHKQSLLIQMIFIVAYTLIITILAPFHWLHPFGPIAKNIPLLVLTYVAYTCEKGC